jgi:hypothetical protein
MMPSALVLMLTCLASWRAGNHSSERMQCRDARKSSSSTKKTDGKGKSAAGSQATGKPRKTAAKRPATPALEGADGAKKPTKKIKKDTTTKKQKGNKGTGSDQAAPADKKENQDTPAAVRHPCRLQFSSLLRTPLDSLLSGDFGAAWLFIYPQEYLAL